MFIVIGKWFLLDADTPEYMSQITHLLVGIFIFNEILLKRLKKLILVIIHIIDAVNQISINYPFWLFVINPSWLLFWKWQFLTEYLHLY